MFTKHKTRKDWRNREWPAGTNVKWFKKYYARAFRRYKLFVQGNGYKKFFEHDKINDFK